MEKRQWGFLLRISKLWVGAGGHFIAVIPALNVVVVHRVNTDDPAKKVTLEQFGNLLRLILAAKKQ